MSRWVVGRCLGRFVIGQNGGLARAHTTKTLAVVVLMQRVENGKVGWVKVGCNDAGLHIGCGVCELVGKVR